MHTTLDPVAVVSAVPGLTASLLTDLIPHPVELLSPYALALGHTPRRSYRAVVAENVRMGKGLSECTAVRWLLPPAPLTVVCRDDPAGKRLSGQGRGGILSYSDGDPFADVTAKGANLRKGYLEFDALTQHELRRIRLAPQGGCDVYAALAALTCALGLGVSLEDAALRLQQAGARERNK